MTMLDPTTPIRAKIIAALKADAQLSALIPPARIYPMRLPAKPVWPFIRVGAIVTTPFRADCAPGGEGSGAVHSFVKRDASIPDPDATAAAINGHVARILDGMDAVDVDGDASLSIHVRQAQVIEDGDEADAAHGFVTYEALLV